MTVVTNFIAFHRLKFLMVLGLLLALSFVIYVPHIFGGGGSTDPILEIYDASDLAIFKTRVPNVRVFQLKIVFREINL